MSKFDLRDISEKLTRSRDTEAIVSEFLGYLQAVRPDWRASLSFYEVSRDSIVGVYTHEGGRLQSREMDLPVDRLPARLVRKFFHPSAFFNHSSRRSMLANLMKSAPAYEPDLHEGPSLSPVSPIGGWQSCACMTLTDREDVIALLVLASQKKNAFAGGVLGDVIPIKSMASLALAQSLQGEEEHTSARHDDRRMRAAAAEFQEQIRKLKEEASELEAENARKKEKIQALSEKIDTLDDTTSQYRQQLDKAKGTITVLEGQSAEATEKLAEAFSTLDATQSKLDDTQRTVAFMREVFQVLSQEHKRETLATTILTWFCQYFSVDRCSLMVLDNSRESLRVAAFRGMAPSVASDVRVRLGQGVAGWVAHHRKPLFVTDRNNRTIPHTDQDSYNSDSFISVPLVYNGRLMGVLNLSNKRDGEVFTEADLDRALLTGSVLAMLIGGLQQAKQRAAA